VNNESDHSCWDQGIRLSEEALLKPKSMINIGGMPILWHSMKIYSFFGVNDFIVYLGYKSFMFKEYFANYFLRMSDVTFDMADNK
jgi:glucose-1-phosphate cytidylyltransferase